MANVSKDENGFVYVGNVKLPVKAKEGKLEFWDSKAKRPVTLTIGDIKRMISPVKK